jgi:hypothetical protein
MRLIHTKVDFYTEKRWVFHDFGPESDGFVTVGSNGVPRSTEEEAGDGTHVRRPVARLPQVSYRPASASEETLLQHRLPVAGIEEVTLLLVHHEHRRKGT